MSTLDFNRSSNFLKEELTSTVCGLYATFRRLFRAGCHYPTHEQLLEELAASGASESNLVLLSRLPLYEWYREYRVAGDSSSAMVLKWAVGSALMWFKLRPHWLKHNRHYHPVFRFYFRELVKPVLSEEPTLGREAETMISLLHMASMSYIGVEASARKRLTLSKSK